MSNQVQNNIEDARRFQRCGDHELAISSLQLAQQEDRLNEYEVEIQKLFSFSLSTFDKIVIPCDSNFILGVDVGKLLGKPVVHMRQNKGRIEREKCWDGKLDPENVMVDEDQ